MSAPVLCADGTPRHDFKGQTRCPACGYTGRPLPQPDVTPLPKVSRPWVCKRDNTECTRAKPCAPCRGERNRRSGLRKQRAAKKGLGVPDGRVASAASNEENWRHIFRWECKSGLQTKPAATRYLDAEAQAEENKAIGDPRPFAAILMPKGWGSEGLVVMRLSVWRQHVAPELETP